MDQFGYFDDLIKNIQEDNHQFLSTQIEIHNLNPNIQVFFDF